MPAIPVFRQLSGAEDTGSDVDFTLSFDGGAAQPMKGTVDATGAVVVKGVKVPGAKLWSTVAPNLHTLAVAFRGGVVTERFGLRSFGVDKNARLTINGEVTKLVGWNHHTQWPVTAASPTDGQMDADIKLLKKGNANCTGVGNPISPLTPFTHLNLLLPPPLKHEGKTGNPARPHRGVALSMSPLCACATIVRARDWPIFA